MIIGRRVAQRADAVPIDRLQVTPCRLQVAHACHDHACTHAAARRTATQQALLRYGVSARTRVFAYFVYSAVPQIHVFRAPCAGQEYVAINCG